MGDDQRERVRPAATLVDEVDAHPVHGGPELGEGVDRPLLDPPVEARSPVAGQLFHVVQVGAVIPAGAGDLVGPAGAGQALTQVFQDRVRDLYSEGLHVCD